MGSSQSSFFEAARLDSLEVLRSLCEEFHVQMDTPDERKHTTLTIASDGGHKAVVQYLLDRNASVEGSLDVKWTPLLAAAKGGHTDIVRLLLDRNANIEARDDDQWTPLIYAASKGHTDIARLLLDQNANTEAKLSNQATPLLLACCWQVKTVKPTL